MSRKKVYIRADADQKIGYGHFIRCLALANMLKNDFDCVFYTQEPNEFQVNEVQVVCQLRILPANDSKFELFLNELLGDEIVVLDNYFFSSDYQQRIKKKGCALVTLGSNDRHYYSDIVLNFTNLQPHQFSVEPYTKLYIGLQWTLLRTPFYKYNKVSRIPHSYSICIGGTDQFCYAEKFVLHLKNIDKKATILVISSDRIGEARINGLHNMGVNVGINLSAKEMADAFAKSEIAIVSASGVAVEALSQHANVITGYYVDNQINIYNTFLEEDYVWSLDDFSDSQVYQKLGEAILQIRSGQQKRQFQASETVSKYRQIFISL